LYREEGFLKLTVRDAIGSGSAWSQAAKIVREEKPGDVAEIRSRKPKYYLVAGPKGQMGSNPEVMAVKVLAMRAQNGLGPETPWWASVLDECVAAGAQGN